LNTAGPAEKKVNTMEKRFLLGVGCQKGGTTWLHDYISQHPNGDFGFQKEYHIFDVLFTDSGDSVLERRRTRALEELQNRDSLINSPNGFKVFKLFDFYSNIDSYFDYFWTLANRNPDVHLTGDITPAYAGLSTETFAMIRAKLVERDLVPRVVFLMRDPVERCISMFRMRMRITRGAIDWNEEEEKEAVRASYTKDTCVRRTQYDQTMISLEQVFKPEEIFYGFYEELFEEKTIRDLTGFLGVEYRAPDFKKQVNVSRTEHELGEEIRREIFDFYRDTYDFIGGRFGADRVKRLWKSYRHFDGLQAAE